MSQSDVSESSSRYYDASSMMNPYGYDLGAIYNAMSSSRVVTTAEDVTRRAAPASLFHLAPTGPLECSIVLRYGTQGMPCMPQMYSGFPMGAGHLELGGRLRLAWTSQAGRAQSPEAMPGMPMARPGKAWACLSQNCSAQRNWLCRSRGRSTQMPSWHCSKHRPSRFSRRRASALVDSFVGELARACSTAAGGHGSCPGP